MMAVFVIIVVTVDCMTDQRTEQTSKKTVVVMVVVMMMATFFATAIVVVVIERDTKCRRRVRFTGIGRDAANSTQTTNRQANDGEFRHATSTHE